ncbi:hypothetical protein AB6A40_010791 [Gnathostoma spinigerum]|uniref:Lipocalin domain-containing protein n=1 Tax=Gnathostoma spinigerum TaxID=75299 RepID=A0ABD6F3E1_9BILA
MKHIYPTSRCFFVQLFIVFAQFHLSDQDILGIFGLSNGHGGSVNRVPLDDITSQSIGILSYLRNVKTNLNNNALQKLREPLPDVPLLDGVPVVPGLVGSLPGIGGCLPREIPLINERSPSFFQNVLRYIPGVQDYLNSLIDAPKVEPEAMMGKYYWVRK